MPPGGASCERTPPIPVRPFAVKRLRSPHTLPLSASTVTVFAYQAA